MNLFESALMVKVVNDSATADEDDKKDAENNDDEENGDALSRVKVNIVDSEFRDGERGVTLIGTFDETIINGSTFSGNMAMQAGAGILVLISAESAPLIVDNSDFEGNTDSI